MLPRAAGQTVTFDFDTGSPVLTVGRNIPMTQTVGSMTALFMPLSGSFSVQTDVSAGIHLSQFSGKYLYPNAVFGAALRIDLSEEASAVTLLFATTDNPAIETPTRVVLTALSVASGATNVVGVVTNRADYGADTFPTSTITLDGGARTFNRLEMRPIAGGPSTFLVDNVVLTQVPRLSIRAATNSTVLVTWPAAAAGYSLQSNGVAGSIGWADLNKPVEVVNGVNQVSIPAVATQEFYRLVHP